MVLGVAGGLYMLLGSYPVWAYGDEERIMVLWCDGAGGRYGFMILVLIARIPEATIMALTLTVWIFFNSNVPA